MTRVFQTRLQGWSEIDGTREALLLALHGRVPDSVGDQVALAVHELAENGLKYSVDRQVALQVDLDEGEIRVTAESVAQPAEVAVLAVELSTLAAAPDPEALYRERMRRSTVRADGRAGLGLVRIRCEAKMVLTHEAVKGRIRLIATRRLTEEGP